MVSSVIAEPVSFMTVGVARPDKMTERDRWLPMHHADAVIDAEDSTMPRIGITMTEETSIDFQLPNRRLMVVLRPQTQPHPHGKFEKFSDVSLPLAVFLNQYKMRSPVLDGTLYRAGAGADAVFTQVRKWLDPRPDEAPSPAWVLKSDTELLESKPYWGELIKGGHRHFPLSEDDRYRLYVHVQLFRPTEEDVASGMVPVKRLHQSILLNVNDCINPNEPKRVSIAANVKLDPIRLDRPAWEHERGQIAERLKQVVPFLSGKMDKAFDAAGQYIDFVYPLGDSNMP